MDQLELLSSEPENQNEKADLFDIGSFYSGKVKPHFATARGTLFSDDCMAILPDIKDASIDCIFADPPFNLNKQYGARSNDKMEDDEYIAWCKNWLSECIRITKYGGSIFVYNIPKWNILLGAYLMERGLMFRHNISVEIKSSLPIKGKLYPAHYSLLYFTKGKPSTFRKIRTPIEVCRHCGGEVKDYGGHRSAMHPNGVNLKDVWTDIPPVRHRKFKSEKRPANALSTKLLDRAIEISTQRDDVVLDPFGGSGTTFSVCEKKGRRWIGMEWDFAEVIAERLRNPTLIQHHVNTDYVEE